MFIEGHVEMSLFEGMSFFCTFGHIPIPLVPGLHQDY